MLCHPRIFGLAVGLVFLCGCQTAQKPNSQGAAEQTVRAHGLALSIRLDPVPLRPSEARRMQATVRLRNVSSRFIHLEFATTQRFDVLVHDNSGKLLVQWSEDQAFEAVPGHVGINPGESVEYHAAIATRDFQPGKRYTTTVYFPSHDELKVELPFTPEN